MLNVASKRLIAGLAFCLLFLNVTANPVRVKGTIKNIGSPYVYVYKFFGPELLKLDSVKHSNGQFQVKFNKLERGFYKVGESQEKSVMVLLGEDNITITADLSKPETVKVENSKENTVYNEFVLFNDKHNKEINLINQKAQGLSGQMYSNADNYNNEIKKLQGQVDSLNALQRKFYSDLVKNNPGLVVTKFVSMFDFPQNLTKENFFRPEDFTDTDLTRGDMLPSKVSFYFQRFVTPQIDQWKAAAQEILLKANPGTQNREVIYLALIKMFLPYDDAFSRELAKAYTREYPSSEIAKKTLASLPKGPPEIGDLAPEIKLVNPSGKEVALSSLRGKVVLLDFWASWCGPCRKENPNVVRIYNEYKDRGFTVYSVSLDDSRDKWVQAIQKDNLVWDTHVSDLKGWKSSAAALYGVRAIPSTFLIDKDGKVVAVNLRGESLESALRGLFKE